jgi:hypothetical protein
VLTGHQRRTDALQRYGGRPPRAEHVGVDEVRADESGAQPIDESIVRRPLQPPLRPGGEGLDRDAVAAGDANARLGGVPGQQLRRVDPESCQGPRQPQRGQLSATRFEHADDPNNAHHSPSLPTFNAKAADRARAAFRPDTTRPPNGHPTGSSRTTTDPPGFDVTATSRHIITGSLTLASRSLPDASRAPFPSAGHDGLRPTHLDVV